VDAARPDDKSRIVYAGSGASKRHDCASSSQYSTSWRTIGRHMPSGHISVSVRRPQTAVTPISDTGAQPPVAAALPLSAGLTNTHQGTGAAGEGKLRLRAAAMQQLLHCPGLSLPKLSDVVTLRLKSILAVDVCRLFFVESVSSRVVIKQEFPEQTATFSRQNSIIIF
jgi:hypothetical protein